MKRCFRVSIFRNRALTAIGCLALLLAGAGVGRAATYYFDTNSTTPYGDGPGQFRGTGAYWSTSAAGTAAPVTLTSLPVATTSVSSFQFGFGTSPPNTTNSGTVGVGSPAGGSIPQAVGALIFNASGTSGSGYSFFSGTSSVVNVTITGSATNGVSLGTGILVDSSVTGDTTFNSLVGIAMTSSQTWTNNSGTAALNVYGPISGAFSLTTDGIGTILLGGSNAMTNLTIGAGTTRITNASAAGGGGLTVNAGATLNLLAPISKSVANSGTISIGAGGGLTAGSIGTGALSLAGVSGTGASFTSTSAATLAPASVTMAGNSTITLVSATSGILSPGAAMISGAGNILSLGGVIAAGNTYTLLSGASLANTGAITLTGGAVGNQSLALGDSGTIGRTTFTFGSTPTALQLAVTGTIFDLFWNGGASGAWDYTNANWQKDGTGSNILFVQGDAATIGSASTITVDSGTFGGSVQAASLTVNNAAGTVALSGSAISTTGTFGKSETGDLTIANAATYGAGAWVSGGSMTTSGSTSVTSGGLNVSGGSLTANAATVVTAGGLNVSGGSFTSNAATTVTAGGVNVSGGLATLNNASTIAGGITVTGGTAAFNAANTVSGAVSASGGGVISLSDIGGAGAGSISLSSNGTLSSTLASGTLTNAISVGSGGGTLAGANSLTFTGPITGAGPLTKTGAGEFIVSGSLGTSGVPMSVSVAAGSSLRLTGTSKYLSGAVTPGVINGTLTFDNATITTMGGTIASGTGAIVVSGSSSFAFTATGFSTIATPISGPGSLTFDATPLNRVILSGSNSYSGGTFLNRNVGITNGSALGTGPITCIASAGNVSRINNEAATALTVANNVNTGASTLALVGAHPISLTGTISGTGNIRATNGIADLTQQTVATMLNTGTVEMNSGGQVWVSSASNLGSNTSIAFSGTTQTTLVAKGNTGVIPQNVFFGMTSGTAAIDTGGYMMTLGGTLADLAVGTAGAFTKIGGGTLMLTANSTYTGATTVSAGSLLVNGALNAASTVSVASAAALGGSGTIGGSVTYSSGANFVFDSLSTLTVNGASVTFGGFGVSNLQGLSTSTADGTYTLMSGATAFDLTNVSNVGASNAYSLGGGKTAYLQSSSSPNGFQLVVVPEPTTTALVVCGGLVALLVTRCGNIPRTMRGSRAE